MRNPRKPMCAQCAKWTPLGVEYDDRPRLYGSCVLLNYPHTRQDHCCKDFEPMEAPHATT
jgi:hypothetical protein